MSVYKLIDDESTGDSKMYMLSGRDGLFKARLDGVKRLTCNPLKDILNCELRLAEIEGDLFLITGIILDTCWVEKN